MTRRDFSAFEGTRPIAASQRFDVDALQTWLHAQMAGFSGPLTIEQFKGGQSNPTFKLITPSRTCVMRARPGPQSRLLPSAHAIEREYRVMRALAGTGVPVPVMHALCEDEAVIGRAFYIMEYVPGRVLWDQTLPGMTRPERGALYDEMNHVISRLHKIDPAVIGLADYGKPGNYFARQIERWSRQYRLSATEPIPAMERLIEWLPQHLPPEAQAAVPRIVHGDYRLDNLIFHPSEPRVLAILDWELSTLGHPLADFSYHCLSWHIPPGQFRGIAGLDLAALGIPDESEYIRRYEARTGCQINGDWHFYLAYNLFRIASILQGILKRAADGIASSAQAVEAGKRARPMAELGWQYAQRATA